MQPHENLTIKAAQLARVAPETWRDFVQAVAAFANVHRDNLVNSQLPELQVNQGRAQMMATFTKRLETCLADAEKLKKD